MVSEKVMFADFETTVTGENKEQKSTEVWAAAVVGLTFQATPLVFNSIDRFMSYIVNTNYNLSIYFHNLKFDGSFILDWLIKHKYKLAIDDWNGKWREDKYMSKGTFKCTITDRGQWYMVKVKFKNGKVVTFKDSLKLLPFSLREIGKAFKTKHQKLEMEYEGNMHAGGTITPEQMEYIKNDVLVLREAMKFMFDNGHDRLTIGACCKQEYLNIIGEDNAKKWFPSVADMEFDGVNVDSYIRKAYKGGWCYLRHGWEDCLYGNGWTADVNSLYPSMMLDKEYPVGEPTFWKGEIPDNLEGKAWFVRIKCSFKLKEGYLPMIQIKGDARYRSTEWLRTSEICFKGKYYNKIKTLDGDIVDNKVELTLTHMDYEMFMEHYEVSDLEVIDGCWFETETGEVLFGEYINKWANIKKTSTGAMRTLAKLFLNNLYGKFSSKADNTTKIPKLIDGVLHFEEMPDEDKNKTWYIPIGAYITSHARCFTIKAAMANYDNFVYADTDSIHCLGKPQEAKGIKIHPTEFSHWAMEATWDQAIFARQKTYIEHVIEEEMEGCEPYYNIKCAGMDARPKELLNANLSGKQIACKTPDEDKFMVTKLTLEDFKVGLRVPSSLQARHIEGGTLLVRDAYIMRPPTPLPSPV